MEKLKFFSAFSTKLIGALHKSFPNDRDSSRVFSQERVEQITEELRGLIQRMDELRGAAGAAGTTNDTAALAQISQQLEVITVRHNSLIQEQRDLAAILSSANRQALIFFENA